MNLNQISAYGEINRSGTEDKRLTVEEKIIIEKQYVGYPKEPVGPSVELLFNELTDKDTIPVRMFNHMLTALLLILFLVLFPLIALGIKLSSSGPVVIKHTCTGYRGHLFQRYLFRTGFDNPKALKGPTASSQTPFIGRLLQVTHLEELPSVVNILRGEMKFIGPKARTHRFNNYWNNRLSEYYKRFAVKPGLVGIYEIKIGRDNDADRIRNILREELKFLLNPTLTRNIRALLQKINIPLQRSVRRA